MDLEVVAVGNELLLGFTLDSNSADIARALAPFGVRIVRSTTCGDDRGTIRGVVDEALRRTGFVLITGGLGPTRDDVTKKAVAEIFGVPLETDSEYLECLRERFAKLGRGPMPESNRTQAEVPQGALMLPNRRGTAPGLWLEGTPGTAVLLPGIPREMADLLEREVIPRLRKRASVGQDDGRVTLSRILRTTGVSESQLAGDLAPIEDQLSPATLAYLPGVDGVDLRVTVWQHPSADAQAAVARAASVLRQALGRNFYAEENVSLAEVLLQALRIAGIRLAVAESCTGGLVGAKLTSVPGSSDVFLGAVVSYSDAAKTRLLGVPPELIQRDGAVSEGVVRAMLGGVCDRFGADAGVAVTGVAGPGGGTSDKPVGTVWVAARVGPRDRAIQRWFPGGRSEVRHRSAQAALDLARRLTSPED